MRAAILFPLVCFVSSCSPAQDFAAAVKAGLAKAEAEKLMAIPGSDPGWRFLANELKHLQHGEIGAADLAKIIAEGTDPIPEIVRYNNELKALEIELLLMPVPPKASIYPEKLTPNPGTVPTMTSFFAKLAAAGVQVLDLEAEFLKAKAAAPDKLLYCATDSHWSPYGAQLAASLVSAKYKGRQYLIEYEAEGLIKLPEQVLEFHGDSLTDAEKASLPKEKLPMIRTGIGIDGGAEIKPMESVGYSRVLVMGDSHCQVFRRGGAMHATGAGFIDHLATDLSHGIEEVSTQASGGEGPRIEIARRTVKEPDFWKQKRIVVWLFSAREFTQGRWKMIPAKVVKK